MRYGLSLLVCFALSVCANAQTVCTGDKCQRPITAAVVNVATAPVRVVACCGSQATPQQRQVGPIRQAIRNFFGRR